MSLLRTIGSENPGDPIIVSQLREDGVAFRQDAALVVCVIISSSQVYALYVLQYVCLFMQVCVLIHHVCLIAILCLSVVM